MNDTERNLLDAGWQDEPVGLSYLFVVIRRQFLVLLVAPLFFLVLGLALLILAEPYYTATASVYVQVDDPTQAANLSPLDTHVELIQSNRITSLVIEELHLDEVLETTPGRLSRAVVNARKWLNLEAGDSWSVSDDQSFMFRLVRSGLTVEQVGYTSIIAVRYTSPLRSRSVEIADAFAATYVKEVSDAASKSIERRTDLLQKRAEEMRRLASSADEVAQRLLSQNNFAVTDAEDLKGRITEFRQQLSTVNASEAEARARLSLISQEEDADVLEAAALQTTETLEIYNDMTNSTSKLAELQQKPGVSGDTIARLEESIAEMRTSLRQVARRLRNELELELAVIAARRSSILSEMNDILDYGRSTAWSNLLEAQRKSEVYEGIYQVYLNELESVNRRGADVNVRLVSEARPTVYPSFPNYKVLLVLAVTIGIVVGAGLAMYREWARSYARMRARRASHGRLEPL